MAILTFNAWSRERVGALATAGIRSGRASGSMPVTLSGTDARGAPISARTESVPFLLAGPTDVAGLRPGAVTNRYPPPGTPDAETDKCPYVEFATPQLAWSYSPDGNPATTSGALRAWVALVVGVEGDELTFAGGDVVLTPSVQAEHPLGATTSRWAHEQVDESGRRIGRVLCGRQLQAATDYTAVLVPAFTPAGTLAWTAAAPVTLPVLDRWSFQTSEIPGGFRDLAARLELRDAPNETGRALLAYPRVPGVLDLEVRGALAPIGGTDMPLPAEVAADLHGLRTPARDSDGRPIVRLPRYGDAWVADTEATDWGRELNEDPRHRGVAGVGLEIGIRQQELLVQDAAEHAGALQETAQRLSHLVSGLHVSEGLWNRRLPTDPMHRLLVLGPALRRVVTPDGPVAGLATAEDRALPAGVFSTAARRMFRPGPARTARLGTKLTPAMLLAAANQCPEWPWVRPEGVPLWTLGVHDLDWRIRQVLERGEVDLLGAADVVEALDPHVPPSLVDKFEQLRGRLSRALRQGTSAPVARAVAWLLAARAVQGVDSPEIPRLIQEWNEIMEPWEVPGRDPEGLIGLVKGLQDENPEEPPCRPIDLHILAAGVASAFDPTSSSAPALHRVLECLTGLDPNQPLAPPDVCVGLDRPVWQDIEQVFPEWLLPGVDRLPDDSVIALQTNPSFTDACLVGLNTQLLSELRWRNMPVATGCSPLRVFWGRAHTQTGARMDDIVGIANWPAAGGVGAAAHRPAGAADADLALVIRGQLFLRYPQTVVYLVSALHDGVADFDQDPAATAPRILPSFQGRIGYGVAFFGFQGVPASDVRTHWVVFEEPPQGYRFYTAGTPEGLGVPLTADGADWAAATFADPVRVLIRGSSLVQEPAA